MQLSCGIAAAFFTAVAAPWAAAGVLVVGPNGYADIAPAVAAAVDGDVILVRAGSYNGFTVDNQSLSIVADTNAFVSIHGGVVVQNVQAGKSVVLAGLTIRDTFGFPSLLLQNDAGSVRAQGLFTSTVGYPLGTTYPPIQVVACADVSFTGCTSVGPDGISSTFGYVSPGMPAFVATSSKVALTHCALDGGVGIPGHFSSMQLPLSGSPGGVGFVGTNVELFARGTVFRGGAGGQGMNGTYPPPSCNHPYNYATSGGTGGAGLSLSGAASTTILVASTAQGGAGGLGGSNLCGVTLAQAPDGPPYSTGGTALVNLQSPPQSFDVPQPARESQSIALHFEGVPGDSVVLLLSTGASRAYLPVLRGVLLVQPPLRRLGLGTIAPSGVLDVQFPVPPDLGAGVAASVIHAQAVFVGAQGRVQLGAPGVLLMLDSAY